MPDGTPQSAHEAIALYLAEARAAAKRARDLDALESEKPLAKDRAIRQTMEGAFAAGREMSYTAAERVVEAEPTYAALLNRRRELALELELARSEARAAELLALASVNGIASKQPMRWLRAAILSGTVFRLRRHKFDSGWRVIVEAEHQDGSLERLAVDDTVSLALEAAEDALTWITYAKGADV